MTQDCDDNQSLKELEGDLIRAVENRNMDKVKIITPCLKKAGKQTVINQAAHLAIKREYLELFQYFIDNKFVDINSKDPDGLTYLLNLCYVTRPEAIKLFKHLVEDCGINEYAKDPFDRNPLHLAIWYGNMDIVKYFSNKFPDMVEGEDKKGQTPLFYAVEKCRLDCVEFLIREHNCDCQKADKGDQTPLRFAKGEVKKYKNEKKKQSTTQDESTVKISDPWIYNMRQIYKFMKSHINSKNEAK